MACGPLLFLVCWILVVWTLTNSPYLATAYITLILLWFSSNTYISSRFLTGQTLPWMLKLWLATRVATICFSWYVTLVDRLEKRNCTQWWIGGRRFLINVYLGTEGSLISFRLTFCTNLLQNNQFFLPDANHHIRAHQVISYHLWWEHGATVIIN